MVKGLQRYVNSKGPLNMSDIFRDYSFGGQLGYLRREKRLTLRECVKQSGVDPGNYCKMEQSELPPPSTRKKCIELFDKLGIEEKHRPWLIDLARSFHMGKVQERFTDYDTLT